MPEPDDETPGPLDDLMPRSNLMQYMWLGSLEFAIGRDDVLSAFRAETGNQWKPGKTPIDQMIDDACGTELAFIRAFAEWHNRNVWGVNDDGTPIDVPSDQKGGD